MNLKKYLLLAFLAFFYVTISIAQVAPQWMRYPAISPDGSQIVFTYKGDLYLVPSKGGDAKQITFHEAHDYKPVWSKDGSQIAFASDRYGNFDIFIMSASGGPASRLTFHSNDELPFEFSSDNEKIIFGTTRIDQVEHRQYPTGSQPELYEVPKKGGRVDQVWTIPAEYVQSNKTGDKMIYHDKKGGENEWRKHHQSGVARDIWLYDAKTNSHKMLTSFYGEDRNPVFSPDESEIYYLSETSGNFNVYAMSFSNPASTTALTDLKTYPVRFLSISNEGLMSFSYDGELYTLNPHYALEYLKGGLRF